MLNLWDLSNPTDRPDNLNLQNLKTLVNFEAGKWNKMKLLQPLRLQSHTEAHSL